MDLEKEALQRVGTTLCNKWTLEGLIGTGGMAAVYVATHRIGRREAIKILHSDVAKDPDVRARFEQEAHAVNRFKHPGAVEVRDIDVAEDGSPFLVMELLEGETLASLSRRDAISTTDLLRWIDELLDVLAAAHARGIIHRDIKPDNLFIQTDGRLKVLDFGIARVRASTTSRPRTRAGATLGTATYMPPEQIHGTEIDARADLFAVGATMFRILAKRRLHEAPNEAEMLVKMGSIQAPSLHVVAPEVPHDIGLVVDRALMFDRGDRYPDAITMQNDVRSVRDNRTPPFATARLEDGPSSTTKPLPAKSGPPPTAAAPASHVTKPASPAALVSPPPADEVSPETVDAQRVGAAALPSSPVARPPEVASPSGSPKEAPTPRSGAVAPSSKPGSDRTLRSVLGPQGTAVEPHGVAVEVIMPTPRLSARPGPSTQMSGVAVDMAHPGESVRVVEAPPRPRRFRTLSGTEIRVWPLVLVGVVFAAIGVGVTLGVMLHEAPPDPPSPPHTTHPATHPQPTHKH